MFQQVLQNHTNEVFIGGSISGHVPHHALMMQYFAVVHDTYFEQRIDVLGRFGLSTLQKITTVFRMLALKITTCTT
ncbi:hypothetical protein H5410_006200 [Solanum commersonii]|uniref:Uncharacterized protein n=1 Tax=Solanum commersonii TaxID=4109 RepID=A0A9J6A8I8_SOLCO|nr:hypothetical protein H5410_006200 [Solanum commersonii]